MSEPLAQFRVYPDGTFFYAKVNVWPTKKAMFEHCRIGGGYEAVCRGQECYVFPPKGKGRARKTGLFAEINFHRRALGVEVASHEFSHAAFEWSGRRRIDLNSARNEGNWRQSGEQKVLKQDCDEEKFCYALGRMVRQFTQKCYDIGLYRDVVEVED